MKKLLCALTSMGAMSCAFATTTVTTFDSSQMKCGTVSVTDGMNSKDLKRCKKFKDKKTDVVFYDDHSKKMVDCKVDSTGKVAVAECNSK